MKPNPLEPGTTFGRLTVLSQEKRNGRFHSRCRCDCGSVKTVYNGSLRNGDTKSCGCWHREHTRTHGRRKDPLYMTWTRMKARCLNPRHQDFLNYGGRGIEVHEQWANDFTAFAAWVDENIGSCPEGMSIDRINNDGHYEPGNVRWATPLVQSRNRRPYQEWTERPGGVSLSA